MTESLTLEAYGRVVTLRGPVETLALAKALLPPAYRKIEPSAALKADGTWAIREAESAYEIVRPDGPTSVRRDLVTATELALSRIELWVAEHARELVFVHAGCVMFGERAIVLPGYTLSGKTTLTQALLRAGATYLSDEYAVLDADGLVHPYPRLLSVRDEATRTVRRIGPAELGAHVAAEPVRVGVFALLRHAPEDGWLVTELSRSRGILALLSQTIPAQARPLDATNALGRATDTAVTLEGTRGEADEAAAKLLQLLEASA